MVFFIILFSIVTAAFSWLLYRQFQIKKRKLIFAGKFHAEWVDIIKNNFPLYQRLPEKLKQQLHGHINVFLAEKAFYGCNGLNINDEMRITIAAQACLLLLNRKTDYYPNFRTILVYPDKFTSIETHYDGYVEVKKRTVRLGESWHRGPVIISWQDAKAGARDASDGENVVMHEFAHKLDEENPGYPGLPILNKHAYYKSWAQVMSHEYETLLKQYSNGHADLISQYAATSPAEFFAVISELFFERPLALLKKHPELYQELKNFYQVDPKDWH